MDTTTVGKSPGARTAKLRQAGWIAAAIIGATVIFHLVYLWSRAALDLTGDEAYYWEWSRRLDFGYYSKPPLVAWIIRVACELFGNSMPAVRLPAVLLGAGSLGLAYYLCRKLYHSERMALGVIGVMCAMPMLMAGSVLMTIDAPLFFLLAIATVGAAIGIFDERRSGWLIASVALFVAMLAKPAAAMWLICPLAFLLTSPSDRRQLRTPWPYVTAVGCALGLAPLVIWNYQHGWITARHIAHDLGETERSMIQEFGNYVSGQLAVASPPIMIAIVAGAWQALRKATAEEARRERFLVAMGAPFLIMAAVVTLWSNAQPNWTAPGYFALAILATYHMASVIRTRNGRLLVIATVIFGALALVFAHFGQVIYHSTALARSTFGTAPTAARFDIARRGRGWSILGREVAQVMKDLPEGTMIMAPDYQTTALATFYTPGNPPVYRIGTCLQPPTQHWSQYELWPDRLPISPELKGRDALVILTRDSVRMPEYFDSFQVIRKVPIEIAGEEMRTFYLYRGTDFKGMSLNGMEVSY